MSDAVANFVEHYRALGLDGSPCSAADVKNVERDGGNILPAAYKAYLLIAGREPPAAWVGSDCTICDLPKLFGWAAHLLSENHQPPLPEQAFVFIMHQGYQFKYFIADGNSDDPPVFYYLEGEPKTVRQFERLSDLLAVVARDSREA
jgi:SMI1 / KNR4 family (SUKH-1)